MRELPPCKYCEFRHAGCHAECEPYKSWLTAFREDRQKAYESRRTDADKVIIDGIRKAKRYNYRHRPK